MYEEMDTGEFEEFKENMQRDLNAEKYPFVVEIKKNKVVARWKAEQEEPFSVTYTLRANKTFCGGETTLHRDMYHPQRVRSEGHIIQFLRRRCCAGEKKSARKTGQALDMMRRSYYPSLSII